MNNRILLLLALLLPACSEYSVSLGSPEPAAPPPDEICNGVDDDGDGDIDEDQPDTDGDGVADCVDTECAVELAAPRSELDPACEGDDTPPVSPWELTTLWEFPGIILANPMVGDLDGDGVAEVVLTHAEGELGQWPHDAVYLSVLDGATGAIKWSDLRTYDNVSSVALADLDGDGDGDIVSTDGQCLLTYRIFAHDGPTGDLLWGPVEIPQSCGAHPAVGDLDGDGTVEVVVNEYVLDGATGAVELILPVDAWYNYGTPVIVDMDLDGQQEIIIEGVVFSNTGEKRMQCGPGGFGTYPAPVNVDADPEGELLVVSNPYGGQAMATLCDDDGTVLWNRISAGYGSGPAVADLTGDGLQEVVIHENYTDLVAVNGAGEVLWKVPAYSSLLRSSITWDIDLDGVPEVIYSSQNDLLILDGLTGQIRWSTADHEAVSPGGQAVVADVDGDGTGDLLTSMSTVVYGGEGGFQGLRVRTALAGDWPDTRPTWNQLNHWGDNIPDDLSVPQYQEPPWRTKNNIFRGQPGVAPLANLRGEMTDLCASSCEAGGLVQVAAQVWNDGAVDVPETVVELQGTDGEVLASATVGPVPAGGSVELILETSYEAASGGLELVVDGSGTHTFECREDDNRATIEVPSCP